MQPGGKRLRYNLSCSYCNYKFANEHDLIVHQATHSQNHYSCDRCLFVFTKESQLEHHRTVCQGGKKPHVCVDCGDVFKTGNQLDEHHRRVHASSKVYECKSCGATFSWYDNLVRHERMHRAESSVCGMCGAIFGSSASLKVHLWKVHSQMMPPDSTGLKSFMCQYCKKTFRFSNTLKTHSCVGGIQHTSSSNADLPDLEKPYQCDYCDKSFKYDFSYEAHLRCHVDVVEATSAAEQKRKMVESKPLMTFQIEDPEKPNRCNICGMGFKYDFSLTAHMKSHMDLNPMLVTNHGDGEDSGPMTMVQFAEMIQHGMQDDGTSIHGAISIEPIDDQEGAGMSVEMYDFSDQEVTMLPASQLPSGLLNLLFQQSDNSVEPGKAVPAAAVKKIPKSSNKLVTSQKSQPVAGMAPVHKTLVGNSFAQVPVTFSPVSDTLAPIPDTLAPAPDRLPEDVADTLENDCTYTIHSVILDGMRTTAEQDE